MVEKELQIASDLTGVDSQKIKFSDEGFLSRGYIIDDGRIVFKFKKYPEISYQNEIKMLNFLNSQALDVNLQKVGWISKDDSYLGLYGVIGQPLVDITLNDENRKNYGWQISSFLQKLHSIKSEEATKLSLTAEISDWQKRFKESEDLLSHYFNPSEIAKMSTLVNSTIPQELVALGEKMVFSHGDLWLGNIFIDNAGKIGIIDFSESGYLDEAADFMDIEDDALCAEILNTYGADDTLRKKVKLRKAVRPMFVIGTYREKPEEKIQHFVRDIRKWLQQDLCI